MERNIAESLMQNAQELNSTLNKICQTIEKIEGEELKREMRSGVAMVMSEAYFRLMHPIIAAHPDLDPDIDQSSGKD
ncbi:nuclear receptor NHR-99 [Massilia sp. BJB1822]|uniref:nuclear receptor NHR-99 n=1 Tax=Massilia sp. BJB1822 TaxID=2744470 RepID=UPI001593B7B7|nr:nuclear receptor NHR-99 [Massilia sp. BJB1822]NVE00299.1 nuclear receptor NHR-99 [Massilia sp. BJB1822]